MDCLDGKQARRTKNSSPLGQLFDHGGRAWLGALKGGCRVGVGLLPALLLQGSGGAGWKEQEVSPAGRLVDAGLRRQSCPQTPTKPRACPPHPPARPLLVQAATRWRCTWCS